MLVPHPSELVILLVDLKTLYKKRHVSLKLHKSLKLIYSEKAGHKMEKICHFFFFNFVGFSESLNFKAGVDLLSHEFQVASNFTANFQILVPCPSI